MQELPTEVVQIASSVRTLDATHNRFGSFLLSILCCCHCKLDSLVKLHLKDKHFRRMKRPMHGVLTIGLWTRVSDANILDICACRNPPSRDWEFLESPKIGEGLRSSHRALITSVHF